MLAVITVGKATLMHCQDPPAAELKPSKCGEPVLDPIVAPKIEQLATGCPALSGVSGRLQVGVDLNFKTQALKLTAGKNSALQRAGKRDEKAIDPILACLRTSLKDVLVSTEGAPAREHARYVLFFPVTLTSPSGAAAPSPSASEKVATGTAKVEVNTAIVRDAPNTTGQPIGRLSRDTRVTIVGTSGNWFHIRFGENDAQEGWVFRANLGK
jgi:hypothetical protein